MKIFVTAKPSSKKPRVLKTDERHFIVAVKESPKEGKANRAIIKALAKALDIPQSRIELVAGMTSKRKILETT